MTDSYTPKLPAIPTRYCSAALSRCYPSLGVVNHFWDSVSHRTHQSQMPHTLLWRRVFECMSIRLRDNDVRVARVRYILDGRVSVHSMIGAHAGAQCGYPPSVAGPVAGTEVGRAALRFKGPK